MRSGKNRFFAPLFTLFLVILFLGGCSTSGDQCLVETDEIRMSTSGSSNLVPKNCIATSAGKTGVTFLKCQGGREGYMVNTASGI